MSPVLPNYLEISEREIIVVRPEDPFNIDLCVQPAVLQTTMNEDITDFMKNWSTAQIVDNFVKIRPNISRPIIQDLLTTKPTFVLFSGADLIYSKGHSGEKEFLVIESNTSTGGQDAMSPSSHTYENQLNCVWNTEWKGKPIESGGLAHMFGRKTRRAYANSHIMAQLTQEPIHVIPSFSKQADGKIEKNIRYVNGTMEVKSHNDWLKIRACFYAASIRPWTVIPVTNNLKTYMCPHPIAALVGNKILSEYAYRDFDEKYAEYGIKIRRPRTVVGISKEEIKRIVQQDFNGRAVIKTPYDSQGRGVYVITNVKDLDYFYATDQSDYNLWVIQELIGVDKYRGDRYQQVGFQLDGHIYAYSLRMIACASPSGLKLTTICGARASTPFAPLSNKNVHATDIELGLLDGLLEKIETAHENDVYITNIGSKPEGELRSFYVDDKGMKGMNIAINDIVDGFMQSVYCIHAIDNMCQKLTMPDGELNLQLLEKLNPDPQLFAELVTNWK